MNETPSPNSTRTLAPWMTGLLAGLIVLVASVLVFGHGMERDLNHDEHQFLAPGAMLARHGFLPYRDFPLFHLPNLVFVYAAIERLGIDLVLGAKFLSIFATCVVIGLLVREAVRRSAFGWRAGGILVALGAVMLLVFDPIFFTTTGKTWNHEVPTALALGALLLIGRAGERNSLGASMLAGLAAGLAVGFRLTFAPILVPLTLAALLYPWPWRRRFEHGLAFAVCATVALAPSLYFFCMDREAFMFGNFEFPRLRLLDPENTRIRKTMTLPRKFRYFAKEIIVPSWPVFLGYFTFGVAPAWTWLRRRERGNLILGVLLLTLPFVLAGCLAPSRYQYQHYYVLVPFLVLGIVLGLQSGAHFPGLRRFQIGLLAVISICSMSLGVSHYRKVYVAWNPGRWFAMRNHSIAQDMHKYVAGGKVLTLAPVYPLVGNFDIYREFATGPFAWRGAYLVPLERRRRLHLVAPEDLEAFLAPDPPSAILTGYEEDGDLERPLIDYAKAHGYRVIHLSKGTHLWVPHIATE